MKLHCLLVVGQWQYCFSLICSQEPKYRPPLYSPYSGCVSESNETALSSSVRKGKASGDTVSARSARRS